MNNNTNTNKTFEETKNICAENTQKSLENGLKNIDFEKSLLKQAIPCYILETARLKGDDIVITKTQKAISLSNLERYYKANNKTLYTCDTDLNGLIAKFINNLAIAHRKDISQIVPFEKSIESRYITAFKSTSLSGLVEQINIIACQMFNDDVTITKRQLKALKLTITKVNFKLSKDNKSLSFEITDKSIGYVKQYIYNCLQTLVDTEE